MPRDLDNVLVVANINGQLFKVMSIDTLPGLQRLSMNFPWRYGSTFFQSVNGEIIDLSNIDEDNVSFSIIPQDEVQTAITDINIKWVLKFPNRVILGNTDVCRAANVVWRQTRPQDARYILSFMIKAAQTVSQPKFYEFWMKTPFQNFEGGIADQYTLTTEEFLTYSEKEKLQYNLASLADGKYFNKTHRQNIFDKYVKKNYNLGMVGGGGLGGGSSLGLNHNKIFEQAWNYGETAAQAFERNDWFLPDDDKSISQTPWKIMGHEAGHTLGFGHKETYTVRNKYSHMTVGNIVYSWLLANDKAIVTADTMVGRDESWEQSYNKKAMGTERSRPRCGDAFEWGGAYERHDIKLPVKLSEEWFMYLDAHSNGTGLEYLKSLND